MPTKEQTRQETEVEEAAALEGQTLTLDTQPPFTDSQDELARMLAEKEALIAELEAKLAGRTFPDLEEPSKPVEVVFRCEQAPNLTQYISQSVAVEFKGQFYRTSDQGVITILREMIDKGTALFYEDDPVIILKCPYCQFTSSSWATVKTHSRSRHPDAPALPEGIPGQR